VAAMSGTPAAAVHGYVVEVLLPPQGLASVSIRTVV
jgi:hypothetical protein